MLNRIVSVPGLALASMIACRKELMPPSSVLVTVKVAPTDGMATDRQYATGKDGGRPGFALTDSAFNRMVIFPTECSATRRKMHAIIVKVDRECEVPDPT